MKSKMNIKSIVIMATIGIISLFFINMSLAHSTGTINVETANLRETADENAKILEQLSINQEVEVIEEAGDWCKIKADGITGYVRQDLIAVSVEEDNTTSNETTTEEVVTGENQETTIQTETITETEEKEIELATYKIVEDTNLKIVPVINATDIIEVKKDEEVQVIEIMNGWVCIETKNTKGWLRKEKLQTEEQSSKPLEETTQEQEATQTVIKTLFVNTTTVNLRKEANTTSEVVASLPVNTAVDVIAELDGWYQVKVGGKEGYISASLLSATKQETSRNSTTARATTQETTVNTTTTTVTSGNGSAVVATAQQYIGCKYVYGGTTPNGFDCSGFTSYVYKLHGVTLSRTAAEQNNNGVAVNRSDLQPGDLVMFGPSGISHVGIYIGGGMMIHAANTSRGVTTDTITSGYYNTNYVGARRVI